GAGLVVEVAVVVDEVGVAGVVPAVADVLALAVVVVEVAAARRPAHGEAADGTGRHGVARLVHHARLVAGDGLAGGTGPLLGRRSRAARGCPPRPPRAPRSRGGASRWHRAAARRPAPRRRCAASPSSRCRRRCGCRWRRATPRRWAPGAARRPRRTRGGWRRRSRRGGRAWRGRPSAR